MEIKVNKTIVVNGQRYSSLEEMPEPLRRAYEAAMAAGGPGKLMKASGVKTSISFNGKQFASVDSMPPEMRRLYDLAMAAASTETTPLPSAGIATAKGMVKKDGVFVKAPLSPDEILQQFSVETSLHKQVRSQMWRAALLFVGLVALGLLVFLLRR